jgi:hypothetical protein
MSSATSSTPVARDRSTPFPSGTRPADNSFRSRINSARAKNSALLELRDLDVDNLTPVQALNALEKLKKKV